MLDVNFLQEMTEEQLEKWAFEQGEDRARNFLPIKGELGLTSEDLFNDLYEAEQTDRQVSPFEITAYFLNWVVSNTPVTDIWDKFEQGINSIFQLAQYPEEN